jgi:SAM-dependent methyltransferase
MKCTICDHTNTEVAFLKNEYRIVKCKDCNHVFTDLILTGENVELIYSDDYFFGGGIGYDDYTQQERLLTKRGEYYAEKMSRYMMPGAVLDIGSAAGFILKGFENKGWKGTGIEPNSSMAEYGRSVVGVDVKQGTIECVKLKHKFDLIILIQVIGHINNLKDSLDKMSQYLNPGGHILIETWDKDSLTARIFGKQWHEFSPPTTLNYFSEGTLCDLMSQFDFSLVDHGTPKKRIYSSHAKSLIKHKIGEVSVLKWAEGIVSLIPDNIILPYPSEDLFWCLFKKI